MKNFLKVHDVSKKISYSSYVQETWGSPSNPGGHLQTAELPLFSQIAFAPELKTFIYTRINLIFKLRNYHKGWRNRDPRNILNMDLQYGPEDIYKLLSDPF